MAEWKDTPANRRYLAESLWAMGVPEMDARDLMVRANEPDFNKLIGRLKLKPEQLATAKRMAVWRADPKQGDVSSRVKAYMSDVLGYDAKEVGSMLAGRALALARKKGIEYPGTGAAGLASAEALYLEAAKEILSPAAFTQMAIKTRAYEPAQKAGLLAGVPTWNPLRGDKPPGTPRPPKPTGASGGRGLGGIMKTIKPARPAPPGGGGPRGLGGPAGDTPAAPVDWAPEAMPEAVPRTPAEIKAEIEATYGWAAGLAQIPEIAKILDDVYNGRIDITEADARFKATQFYKTTTQAERTWKILQSTDPADAKKQWQEQYRILEAKVKGLGVEPGSVRIDRLTDLSLTYGWNEGQINTFLASEIKYDPTKQKAGIFKQLGDVQRDYLVPLSDSAKTAWAQAIVGGTKTAEDFAAYLRTSAISMFPALANALEDPNMTVRTYLDPYNQTIAKTLGMNDADIDWEDPKFQRFIHQVDPKTNMPSVMSLADVQRTLRTDAQYGYADTAAGKSEKAGLARTILEDFGLAPTSSASFR